MKTKTQKAGMPLMPLAVALLSCTFAAGSANALPPSSSSLLFPYWSTENGTVSILSLAAGPNLISGGAGGNIHYVWNYGPSCTHFDNYGTMTPNDLLQQFVSAPAGTPALFGDQSTPAYFPQVAQGSHGFLIVTNNGGSVGNGGQAGALRGQMVLASASAGIVTAYSGIPAPLASNEGNFFGVGGVAYRLSWYPGADVGTSWFAVVTGDESGAIGSGSNWNGAAQYTNGGVVYGRDEDSYSGAASGTFTCSTMLTPSSFMNSAQIASTGNGGVVNVGFTMGTTDASGTFTPGFLPATGVVLYKLETTTALGSLNTFITPEVPTIVIPLG